MSVPRISLCSFLILFCPQLLFGQQPFYTDDADVTPEGKVHVEVFDEYDWLPHLQTPHVQQNTFNMRINYGLTKRLEFDLDSPLITIFNNSTTTVRRANGIGDTNFGLKFKIREENGRSPAVTAAAYIETPTGNPTNDLGSGLVDTWIYAVLQKTLSPAWVGHLNGGYLFTGNTSTGVVGITTTRGHIATTGASVVHIVTRRLDLGAEVTAAVTRNTEVQRAQLQWMVGGNYEIHDGVTLDIGILGGHFVASPRFGLQIGFSFD